MHQSFSCIYFASLTIVSEIQMRYMHYLIFEIEHPTIVVATSCVYTRVHRNLQKTIVPSHFICITDIPSQRTKTCQCRRGNPPYFAVFLSVHQISDVKQTLHFHNIAKDESMKKQQIANIQRQRKEAFKVTAYFHFLIPYCMSRL